MKQQRENNVFTKLECFISLYFYLLSQLSAGVYVYAVARNCMIIYNLSKCINFIITGVFKSTVTLFFIILSQLIFSGPARPGGSDYVNLHQTERDKVLGGLPHLIGRLCSFKSRCPLAFIGTNRPLWGEDIFYSNAALPAWTLKVLKLAEMMES